MSYPYYGEDTLTDFTCMYIIAWKGAAPTGSRKRAGTINVNEGWPENARYVPAAPGSRNICLKAQPKHMKMVLKSAIIHVTRATLFDTASLHQTCKNSGNIIAKLS